MIVYKDRSFCHTTECPHFTKECKRRGIVADNDLMKEAEEFGLPVDIRHYDLDQDDKPLNCFMGELLYGEKKNTK